MYLREPLQDIDLLLADSKSLVQSTAVKQRALAPLAPTKPQIVLLTSSADSANGAAPMPPVVSAYLSMHCRQDDLLSTVCGLIGSSIRVPSSVEAAPRDQRRSPAHVPPARGGLAPSALRRVQEHIESCLSGHLDLAELASLAGLSPCHFSRAFKKSMGMPPHRHLTSRRVIAAAKLIEATDRSRSEIALDVGFL